MRTFAAVMLERSAARVTQESESSEYTKKSLGHRQNIGQLDAVGWWGLVRTEDHKAVASPKEAEKKWKESDWVVI